MNDTAAMAPAIPQIHLPANGPPELHGVRCVDCGQAYLARPTACPACCSRKPMEEFAMRGDGKLYSWTVIYRSFPGVRTPFVMAVVDMAEGLALRGTLEGVDPDPAALRFDLPVRFAFRDSGQRDEQGRPYVSFVFVPAEETVQ